MDEIIRQATTILRGMWKHRWLGLVVAWVVGALSVVVVLCIPDKYEASARIYVDTQSILKPLMSGLAIEPNLDQQIMILSRTLISRPNVEKLIRMADLDLNIKTKQGQDELVDGLRNHLAGILCLGSGEAQHLDTTKGEHDESKRHRNLWAITYNGDS